MKNVKCFNTYFNVKYLFPLFLLFFCFSALYSQQNDDVSFSLKYDTPTFDTCYSPKITVNAVVYTKDVAKAYLEFEDYFPIKEISVFDEIEWFGDFKVSNGSIVLENLKTDNSYSVYTINSCGEEALLDVVVTKIEKRVPLSISKTLFSELSSYLKSKSTIPINEFLESNRNVSYYERLSYFQQHLLQGAAFDEFPVGETFPEVNRADLRGGSGRCDCTFAISTVEFVAPGNQVTSYQNSETRRGNISTLGTCSNNNNWVDPFIDYNSDSKYWWSRGQQGPSNYHQLWSTGKHAGGSDRATTIDETDMNGTGLSANYATLQYMFNCTNYANVPEGCDCDDKPIRFDWRYDTYVTTFAELRSGLGNKYGAAASQDIATLLYMDDDGVEVLDAGTIQSAAECSKSINSDFWVSAAELAGSVAIVVAAANGSVPITPGQITAISNSLQQLIGTPLTVSEGCDQESSAYNVLMAGNTVSNNTPKYLKINVPTSVTLSSFSNLGVWGKRGWRSWARIHSSFQLNAVVKGGFVNGSDGDEDDYCCTRTIGSWITASSHSPSRINEFQGLVGLHFANFFLNQPPTPSGAVLIQHEYGYMTERVNPDCNFAQINQTSYFGGGGDSRDHLTKSPYNQFEIHDMMGRLIYRGKSLNLYKNNAVPFIKENGLVSAPGIYVITIHENGSRESWKVYIQ